MEEKYLHLFDVSQYISSGTGIQNFITAGIYEGGDEYKPMQMPCGGLTYLCKTFFEYNKPENKLVYCFDRTPIHKREFFELHFPTLGGYKGKRPKKDNSILYQRKLAEEIVKLSGFETIAIDGYEADDCIASIVKYYKSSYDRIYIHSKDSDLFYLVDSTVEIVPLVEPYYFDKDNVSGKKLIINGKHINMSNWETEVMKDLIIPYNTLTFNKMCLGEVGDNIPAITRDMESLIVRNMRKCDFEKYGDNDYFLDFLATVTRCDERTMSIFMLIAPLIVTQEEVQLHDLEYNENMCNYLASEVGYKFRNKVNIVKQDVSIFKDCVYEYMCEKGF